MKERGSNAERPERNKLQGRMQLETAQYALIKSGLEPATLTSISLTLRGHDLVIATFGKDLPDEAFQKSPISEFPHKRAPIIRKALLTSLEQVIQDPKTPEDIREDSKALHDHLHGK